MSITKRFFHPAETFTFAELLRKLKKHGIDFRLSAALSDDEAARRTIGDIGGLENVAGGDEALCLVYLKKPEDKALRKHRRVGMALVPMSLPEKAQQEFWVAVENPEYAFAHLSHYFYPQASAVGESAIVSADKSSDKLIADSAVIGKNVALGQGVVIGERVSIGDNVRIAAYSVIGDDCTIGANVGIGAHATIRCAVIGEQTHILSGAVIGERGFGLATAKGKPPLPLPHIGGVVIGKRVEIGANNTIDRGKFSDTIIGNDVKLDNMVHIAHNVKVGDATIIAGQSGVAGSAIIGKGVLVGGAVAISDGLTVGDGAIIAGGSGVSTDVAANTTVAGLPAQPFAEYARAVAKLRRLGKQREDNER